MRSQRGRSSEQGRVAQDEGVGLAAFSTIILNRIPQLSRDSEPPGQVTIVLLPIQVNTALHNPNLTIHLAGVGVSDIFPAGSSGPRQIVMR